MNWTPEKYRKLYEEMLKEIQKDVEVLKLNVPKSKKDILLLLLTKAKEKPAPKAKYLRKIINKKTNEIMDKAYAELKKGNL